MAAVTICSDLGTPLNKVCHCFHCFHIYFHEVMGLYIMILVFWMLSFKPTFSVSSFTSIKRLFSSSLSAIRMVASAFLRLLIFLPAILFHLVLHSAQHSVWCTLHRSSISRVATRSFDTLLSQFGTKPWDFGNLIFGSFAFSKSNLIIWTFMVHVLLKPGLENFEHFFLIVCEMSSIVW